QTTRSVFTNERSFAVQRGRPSPPGCWFGYSPPARRSSGLYGVTHTLCCANVARFPTGDSGWAMSVGVDVVGMSRYAVGWSRPLRALGLTMRHVRDVAAFVSRIAPSS